MPRHLEGPDLVIPKGSYFAMGDNRDVSYDSRYWGFVPKGNVLGRPLFIAWSLNQTEADSQATSHAGNGLSRSSARPSISLP